MIRGHDVYGKEIRTPVAPGRPDRRRQTGSGEEFLKMRTTLLRSAMLTALLLSGTAVTATADGAAVTVTGAVTDTNRGPFDPEADKLFAGNDLTFDSARVFSTEDLAGLPQVTVSADFPKSGKVAVFTGPLLDDVLTAAGAAPVEDEAQVWIQAMDGYAVEVSRAELAEKGAILALSKDGKDIGIGDFGPTMIAFPRAERDDLADMPDDWWIWQVYHIAVSVDEATAGE
jgi:hypothetical protein